MGDTTIIVGIEYEEFDPASYAGVTVTITIDEPSQSEIDSMLTLCEAGGGKIVTEPNIKTPKRLTLSLLKPPQDPVADWRYVQRMLSFWTHATILYRSSVHRFLQDGGILEK